MSTSPVEVLQRSAGVRSEQLRAENTPGSGMGEVLRRNRRGGHRREPSP
jgi:hypothetical protein